MDKSLEYIANRVYESIMGGNAGFAFSKMIQEEWGIMAEEKQLTLKSGKAMISQYVVAAVQDYGRRAPGLTGTDLSKIYRMVLPRVWNVFKDDVATIKKMTQKQRF